MNQANGHPSGLPRVSWAVRARPVAALLLICLIGVTLASLRGGFFPESRPDAPLGLRRVSAFLRDRGDRISVTAEIESNRDGKTEGRVWWFISEEGPRPWERAIYQSEVKDVALGPTERVTVYWDEPLAVPEGQYEMSAWIHIKGDGGEFRHSDGIAVFPRFVTAPGSSIVRAGPPSSEIEIAQVRPFDSAAVPRDFDLRLAVENSSPTPAKVIVAWDFIAVKEGSLALWHAAPSAVDGGDETVRVSPGHDSIRVDSTTPQLPRTDPREPTAYVLRVTLLDDQGNVLDRVLSWSGSQPTRSGN